MPINYLNTVKLARKSFETEPPSARRGWQITNQTVLLLHQQGETFWGLFAKPSGTNFNGYSIDIVQHTDGHTFDCLGDAEGAAVPQWGPTQPTGMGDPTRWRPPVGTPITPDPGPTPTPPPTDLTARVEALERVNAAQSVLITRLHEETQLLSGQVIGLSQQIHALEIRQYRVNGQTGRSLGHGHSVTLPVEVVP